MLSRGQSSLTAVWDTAVCDEWCAGARLTHLMPISLVCENVMHAYTRTVTLVLRRSAGHTPWR